jgi:bacillithiol biosynthesis deacetylase BshB1
MKIDVLAFGAHPDDVELSCSGTLIMEKKQGRTTGVIDLTEGELGSRGNVETRRNEATRSSEILGLSIRENCQLADGFFEHNQTNLLKIIAVIRAYQPEIVLCNAPEDRHPDHGKGARLVSDACFLSGLIRIETSRDGMKQSPWRPKQVFHYIQDRQLEPDFLYDISETFEQKMDSIRSFETQFHNPQVAGPDTYISKPGFLEAVKYNNQLLGKRIGVSFAEGFITNKIIGISGFDAIISQST